MSIPVLIDMNLSKEWVSTLSEAGWPAIHWSSVGDPRAPDEELIAWALASGHIIFTNDLDFGTALALTQARGPSVLQVRSRLLLPEHIGPLVIATLVRYEADLGAGALVVVERSRSRVRVLPLGKP